MSESKTFISYWSLIFIRYFHYISKDIPFPHVPSENLLSLPNTPAHQTTHSCFLALASPTLVHRAFTGPRASPSIDDWQGHYLLHMRLEPWVSPCVLFGWWFSPWEFWGVLVGLYPWEEIQRQSVEHRLKERQSKEKRLPHLRIHLI